MKCHAAALVATLAGFAAHAEPASYDMPDETAVFRPGDGADVAEANCATCHSTDYVKYQPPHKGADFWEGEVKKMVTVYGAPVTDADAATISAYLAATY